MAALRTRHNRDTNKVKNQPLRGQAGFSLVEVMFATAFIVISSVSVIYAYTSTSLASKMADRSVASQDSLQAVGESLQDIPYDQLLAWNGIIVDRGDHSVNVFANQVGVGLIMLEFVVTDDQTNTVLDRLATYRSGG